MHDDVGDCNGVQRERGSGAVCRVLCRGTRCNKVKSDSYFTAAVDLI